MRSVAKKTFFIIILLLSFMVILAITSTEVEAQVSSERILLVDFGATVSENQFGLSGWNTVIKSSNTEYTSAGPGGLTKVSGSDKLDNYQGIIGLPTTFEAGDEIIVTWYNNTDESVSLWNPLISFEDTDNPDAAPGEPQWYIMKDYEGVRSIDRMRPGETRQSVYAFTSTKTILGIALPTQGNHSFINISANSSKIGIICDKIELVRAVDSKPSTPTNLVAVLNPNNPDSRIDLTWSASQGKVDHYRIYRNGFWVDKTTDTYYTDSNLEHSTEYRYTVQAFRNLENSSEPSDEATVSTAAFQGRNTLIDPKKDLEYLGAFRFPSVNATTGSRWSSRHGDIAYYPAGDRNNIDGDTDYPGSLYAFGHRKDGKIAELSVPAPVLSKNYTDLPRSQTLQNFHDIQPSNTPDSSDVGAPGLAYIPSKDTFYHTFNDNYNLSRNKKITHGSFAPDFSNIQGLWWVGGKDDKKNPRYYLYNKFMSEIPEDWAAAAGIPEQLLLSGGYRAGEFGPGLVTIQPWNDDGSAPAQDAELEFTTLLHYDDSNMFNGWIKNDGWAGVAWPSVDDTSAVVITGEKAYGEYYYGYVDGTVQIQSSYAVPKILPRVDSGKGGCARGYRGMMLFYDPVELAEVAQSDLAPNQLQPYAVLELDRYLLRDNQDDPTMEYWIGSVTFDKYRGLMYVVEQNVYDESGPAHVIHVFKVGDSVAPPTYTIEATAGAGGNISPTGAVTLQEGDELTFIITPESGYQVKDVLVDEISQGPITSYTFQNVRTTHKIHATFEMILHTISGVVQTSDGSRLADVTLNGLPGTPRTDVTGSYSATIPHGWSGTVTLQKKGYTFIPANRVYTNATTDFPNEDYEGILKTYTISGVVQASDGSGLADVVLNGLPGTPRTDATGAYSATVLEGWSGTVTPQKTSYTFIPEHHEYTDISGDSSGQNYTGISRASYFGFDEFGGTWHDTELSQSDRLTWAAAAANILEWANWGTPVYDTAQKILENFEEHWTNETGLVKYGWHWWLNGYEPLETESPSQVDVPGGGNHWPQYNFFDYFYEDWADFSEGQWNNGGHLMETIDEYLHSGYGVTLAAYGDGMHDLTVWGYEYDETGNYTGIWITDPNDTLREMNLVSVKLIGGLWYLDIEDQYGYEDWFIGGVQALDQNLGTEPVPEPGTFLLLGSGLIAVIALKRKLHKSS